METLEQIKADAVEVFHFDRECRPQDRAHAYLGKYRVRRGYNDTAMQVAVTDMIERAYEAGRAEVADANLVQNLRRQLTSIEATVGDAIDLLDESVGGRTAMSDSRVGGYPMGVTDATIERHFGGDCKPRMCGNCRHFCGSDIHVDYGYCHLEFERAYDAGAPDRKEGFWRLAKWAVAWLMGNLLYCEDECGECRDYEEFGL